jgi:quinol monooxygenase YgiN
VIPDRPITVLAQFSMGDAPFEEIDAEVAKLVEAVNQEEPGTLVYAWYRHRDEPTRWTVVEVYTDEDAMKLHLRGPKVKGTGPRLRGLIDFESGHATSLERIAAKGM